MANFCYNCGNELDENAYICTKCGVVVGENKSEKKVNTSNDNGGFGYGVLGFFLPLVGLILYLCWKNDSPNNAKIAGKGALISVIINVVLCVLAFIFSFIIFIHTCSTIYIGFDYDYNLKFD